MGGLLARCAVRRPGNHPGRRSVVLTARVRIKHAAIIVGVALCLVTAGPAARSDARPPAPHHVAALWVADAVCETGHNPPDWRYHVDGYEGGIAFAASTWTAWSAHVRAALGYRHAYQAPAWIQAAVASWGLRNVGRWGCLFHPDVWAHHH